MTYIHKATGERVEPHVVKFYPQGGGFSCSMPFHQFLAEFELETSRPAIQKGLVTSEFWQGAPLLCYGTIDTWNGWGMPSFAMYEADLLVGDPDQRLYWDGRNVCQENDGEIDVFEPHTITVGGEQIEVWPIGAGGWCWDKIMFDIEVRKLTVASHCLDDLEPHLPHYGVRITDKSGEPWEVTFEGPADCLRQMFRWHWGEVEDEMPEFDEETK